VPELHPGTLSAELGSEDGAFTPPSGGGAPAPLHPQGQTPPQGAGLLSVVIMLPKRVPVNPVLLTNQIESRLANSEPLNVA
jgi:hypothetical protein